MRLILCIVFLACSASLARAVEHATIGVDGSGAPSILNGSSDFFLDAGHVTGEYPIRIGASAADDAAGGVLLGSVSELDRGGLYATAATVEDSSPNSNNSRGLAGGLAITASRAGGFDPPVAGTPADANLSAAYFPYTDGWLGGTISSSTVNSNGTFGDLDTYVGASGVNLATNLQANYLGQTGVHKLTIPGVSDTNRQGILVATTASNVGRFPTVAPSLDGDGYIVRTVDNDGYFEFDPASDPSTTNEAYGVVTPFSFAFVPVGTPGVTLARVATNGSSLVEGEQIGVPLVHSGADFTLTSNNLTAPGNFRLEIDGQTPADGTLILTAAGATEVMGGRNPDNVVTYTSDATGWNILSQDIEADFLYDSTVEATPLTGAGQAASGSDTYFNFLFIPNDANLNGPGAIPASEAVTTFSRKRIIGWNAEVTALTTDHGNDPGDTAAFVAGGGSQRTSNVRVDMWSNRGDTAVAVDGAHLNVRDGLLLTTINEGYRDNSASGSAGEYAVTGTNLFSEEWSIVTASAANIGGSDEFNVNFAAAFFGIESGFQMGIGVDLPGAFSDPYTEAKVDVELAGVNALTDGILVARSFQNDDNWASATPKEDGSGWEIRTFDNNYDASDLDNRTEPDTASWLYLPYDSENLVAGLVDSNGSILSSTAGEGVEWSLSKESDSFGYPQYRLSFADSSKNPENGMLLLTGTGLFDSTGTENADNSVIYESDGADFLIRGLDHVLDGSGEFTDFQDTGFMFAYIDFDAAPVAPATLLTGDYNGDGSVDAADYTLWRDSVGTSASLDNDPVGGVVGQQQYDNWRDNYGASLSNGVNTAQAPEPVALVLLSAATGLLGILRLRD